MKRIRLHNTPCPAPRLTLWVPVIIALAASLAFSILLSTLRLLPWA